MIQTSANRAMKTAGKVFAIVTTLLFVVFDIAGMDKPLIAAVIYAAMPATLTFSFLTLIFELE